MADSLPSKFLNPYFLGRLGHDPAYRRRISREPVLSSDHGRVGDSRGGCGVEDEMNWEKLGAFALLGLIWAMIFLAVCGCSTNRPELPIPGTMAEKIENGRGR